jgi:chaperonin GroES
MPHEQMLHSLYHDKGRHMALQMLGMYVALKEKAAKEEEKTPGGIIKPVTIEQGDIRFGKVVSVGPGESQFGEFIKNPVEIGQEVIFDKRFSKPVEVEGQKLQVLGAKDVLGVV